MCEFLRIHTRFALVGGWVGGRRLQYEKDRDAHDTHLGVLIADFSIIHSPLNLSLTNTKHTQPWGVAHFNQSERCDSKAEMKELTRTPRYIPMLTSHIPGHMPKQT